MFHKTLPPNFKSERAGTVCFIEQEGQFLLLKRAVDSYQGGLWTAAPGGKLESNETPLEGTIREVREETGIELEPNQITFIQTVYYQFSDIEYRLHLFYTQLEQKPCVTLSQAEHTEFKWASLQDAIEWPIMRGGRECIEFILNWKLKNS